MRDFVIADCELTTGEIAALTGAKLRAGDPADRPICNVAPLDIAGPSDISFLENSKYVGELYGQTFGRCYGLEVTSLRYFNIFGPRQDPDSPYSGVLSRFWRQRAPAPV